MKLLPFNTSSFSNTLNAADRSAQRKALVAPFMDLFDGNPDDTLQYIAQFTQRCVETGVIGDFDFISEEHPPPSDIDLTDPVDAASWKTDPRCITKGNLLIDASSATIDKMQAASDHITLNNLLLHPILSSLLSMPAILSPSKTVNGFMYFYKIPGPAI
jgi:hypothetical protein